MNKFVFVTLANFERKKFFCDEAVINERADKGWASLVSNVLQGTCHERLFSSETKVTVNRLFDALLFLN